MHSPCSVLLCKTGLQQAVCLCSYPYGDLLFIQVCSDPAPMHCSKVQGKMHSSLFSAAVQNCLTAGSVSLQLPLWTFALHTGVQRPSPNALQQGSGQNAFLTVQCYCAKQAYSRQCVSANKPIEICCSHMCAVTNALQLCSGQNAFPTVQCCSAKQAHSRHFVTAVTPMKISSSYRCAVMQQQCTAALVRAKCTPHCSVLLCKTSSQQAVCHCK